MRTAVDRQETAAHVGAFDGALAALGAPASTRWLAVDTWLRHHPECEPWMTLVSAGTGIVAGAVLWRTPRLGLVHIGAPTELGAPTWLYAEHPPAADVLATAIAGELRRLRRPWFLQLYDVTASWPAVTALTHHLAHATVTGAEPAPQLAVDHDTPLGSHVTRNTRAAVAKARNRIHADGYTATLTWATGYGDIADGLPEIVALHRARNRRVRGHAVLDDPAAAALFCDMTLTHAATGRAHLARLRIDSHLAAFALCFLGDDGALWVYANLVSPEHTRYSAGTIVNADVVRYAWEHPDVRAVDWGAGVQRYKLSGPTVLRPSRHLFAWSSRPLRAMWQLRNGVREAVASRRQ